jgi:hypothetical protein
VQLRSLLSSGALAVGLVVAAACGSEGAGDVSSAESTVDPDPTIDDTMAEPVATTAERMVLDLIGCEQFALVTTVDRAAARAVVPDEFTSGNVLAHVAKQCEDLRVDSISFGAGHFDAQWISVTRPTDIDLSGTSPGADVNYPVLFQSDNMAWQEAVASFGVPMEYAETMTFETTADSMDGGADGSSAVPSANYRWSASGALRDVAPTSTIAHLLLRRDDDSLYVYDAFCPLFSVVGSGQAKLEPEPGSLAHDAFGPEVSGPNYPARLTCNVTIERRDAGP